MQRPANLLAVARGDVPADLVLRDARLVNVFSGEIEAGVDIAIVDGVIAGIGSGYVGKEMIDLAGAYVAPGYIDAHVHIESSLCVPAEFARAVLPRGVTAVVTDPHEIANVAGRAGVEFILKASRGLPLEVIVNIPSCVPATPMAATGGCLDDRSVAAIADELTVHGLAEVMNFPGVIHGDPSVLAKIDTVRAKGRPIDGHAPGVRGKSLNAYVAAGIGSDHECVTVDEAREKLSRGLYVLIREATNARNLDALLPLVTPTNARRFCFCTDDRTPGDLLRDGGIDMMVRRAIQAGVAPVDAIRMATLNTAEWFKLDHLGAIAPGRAANVIVFDDLKSPTPRLVLSRGTLWHGFATRDGVLRTLVETPCHELGQCSVAVDQVNLRVVAAGSMIRVIGLRPDQLLTDSLLLPANIVDGNVESDPATDVSKMIVAERHGGDGSVGVGFINGVGLKRGALAGTIAHDHHNLVAIGVTDDAMRSAMREVVRLGGGLAVADEDGTIVASLALPVGGLMSDAPIEDVAADYDRLVAAVRHLGSPLNDPFMAMSFMALEVIPSLKLTDRGLVDVERFEIVELFVES